MADHDISVQESAHDEDIVLPRFKFSDHDHKASSEPQHRLPPLGPTRAEEIPGRRLLPLCDGPSHLKLPQLEPRNYPALHTRRPGPLEESSFQGRGSERPGYRTEDAYWISKLDQRGRQPNFLLSESCSKKVGYHHADGDEDDQSDEIEHQQMQMHDAYVKKKERTWKLEDAKGVYFVKCDQIAQQYGVAEPDGFRMTIMEEKEHPGRLMAEFDFNVVTGLIRFILPAQDPLPDGESEYESELEAEEQAEVNYSACNGSFISESQKRSASARQTLHTAKKSRVSEPATGSGPLKLLLTWRGRETGEGEIQVDTGSNRGAIQFSDSRLMSFVGRMDFDIVGSNIEIEGFKVADVPAGKQLTEEWALLSWAAHGRAEVARWH